MQKKATHERILAAARRVFGRDGIEAATTRAIAREAGVNEVTLFRHFGTKERLLEAVVRQTFPPAGAGRAPAPTGDLAADLAAFAARYEGLLEENLALVRAFLGEIHRHRRQAQCVLQGIFGPVRSALVARLELALAAGQIRPGIRPEIAADLFNGAILAGVLRRASAVKPRTYRPGQYRRGCVELFHRGLSG